MKFNIITKKENSTQPLFSKLFQSRDVAHILHLKVNGEMGSFAAHSALNSYYEEIIPLLDELIETYQGQYGLIEDYSINISIPSDKLVYFEDLAASIAVTRNDVAPDTHLQNIIDEIVALVYRTIYKLKFLK